MIRKWKWFIITIVITLVIAIESEEQFNPVVLFKILFDRGIVAWAELIIFTTAVLLPSFFITKLLERLTAKIYTQFAIWKSLIIAIFTTFAWYFILMAILEPIKFA